MRAVRRFFVGFGWGLIATISMTLFMGFMEALGVVTVPTPIPVALASRIAGPIAGTGVLMPVAIAAHFGIGAVCAGIYALLVRHSTAVKGLGLGVALWLLLQLAILPWIGWGLFGSAVSGTLWLATLLAHLLYGVTLGALVDRPEAPRLDTAEPAAHAH